MKADRPRTRPRLGLGIAVALAVCTLLPGLNGCAILRNAEVVRLYPQGRYDEAIPLAARALAIGEKALGPRIGILPADVGLIDILVLSSGSQRNKLT